MNRGWGPVVFWFVIIAIMCGCTYGVYEWTDSDCRDRGGHTEIVYGRGGWVCEGATR